MSPRSRLPRGPSPVVAASLLLATLLPRTAIADVRSLTLGPTVRLGLLGVFVGFAAGLAVVTNRSRDV